MNGFYATMSTQHPYLDEAAQPIRFWANKYKTKFNEDPTVFSVYGYNAIDSFMRAVEKSGANVTTESIIKAMDTMVIPPDIFGTGEMTFSRHQAFGQQRVAHVANHRRPLESDLGLLQRQEVKPAATAAFLKPPEPARAWRFFHGHKEIWGRKFQQNTLFYAK